MLQYLVDNPLVTVLLCVGLGYLFGKLDLGAFPNNSTLGTLYTAIILNILISASGARFDSEHLKAMTLFFFSMFLFVLGYEGGPVIRNTIRVSGFKSSIKIIGLCFFYSACVFATGMLFSRVFHLSVGQINGLYAGSQTLEPIATYEVDVIGYVLTYIAATLGMVIFVLKLAPVLIGTDLISAVKQKVGAGDAEVVQNATLSMPIQIRAYRVDAESPYGGKTVDELEAAYEGRLQIESIYRDGAELELSQEQVVLASDVIVVVGSVHDIDLFDNQGLTETSEESYISYDMTHLEIVVSEKRVENVQFRLSERGIMLQRLRRKGREVPVSGDLAALKGDVLSVVGRPQTILKCAEEIGYLKEESDSTDVPSLLVPIAVAIPLGLLGLPGTHVTLGASVSTLILGMIIGCVHDSHPKIAPISAGARWLLKNMGLDLFIAATAFEIALPPSEVFVARNLLLMLVGILLFVIPGILALLFGRYVLRLVPADLLGGMCGCFSSTPALNSLTEAAGSTVFTVGYTPAYLIASLIYYIMASILLSISV